MKYKTHFILMSLLLSLTACGGGGGTPPPSDPDPDPAPTTPTGFTTVIDTGWNKVNRSPIINKAVYAGSKYLAVGDSGYIAESTNGINWTEFSIDSPLKLEDVASNGTNAVAIAFENSWLGYAATTDGTNWQIYKDDTGLACFNLQSVIHDGSQFVAIDGSINICTSTDGVNWTKQSTQAVNMVKMAYGAGKYVFSLNDGGIIVMTALDSTAMSVASLPSPTDTRIDALTFGGNTFVGVTNGGNIISSADGASWASAVSNDAIAGVKAITYSSDRGFSAYSTYYPGQIFSSTDGVNWSIVTGAAVPLPNNDIYQYTSLLASGTSETLMFAPDGSVYSSTNLTSWVPLVGGKPMKKVTNYINQGGNQYVATGDIETGAGGFFVSNDNGSNWNIRSVPVGVISSVIYDGTGYVASGSTGLAYSADGISWGNSSDFYYSQSTLTASAKLGTTTYYFARDNQLLTSIDDVDFTVDPAMATAITNSAGGIVGVFQQAVSNGSVLVARTPRSIVVYDGSSWSVAVSDTTNNMRDIIVSGSQLIVVGDAGMVLTSSNNGVDWTSQSWINAGANVLITDVMDVAGTLYAVDTLGTLASSTDSGVSWALVKDFSTASNVIQELAYDAGNTTFYAFGTNVSLSSPVLRTSTNGGVIWSGGSVLASPRGHVYYDSANSRFVDSLGNESTNGSNWSTVSEYPADISFAYRRASTALSSAGGGGLISYTAGSPDIYTAGQAYSEDGQNWILKTDQISYQGYTPLSGVYANGIGYTSTDGINFSFGTVSGLFNNTANNTGKPLPYANDQYVVASSTDNSGIGIYTSSDGLSWTLQTTLATDYYNAWNATIVDIEYDGSQYLMLSNDQVKGVMIVTSTDLQTFTVHETGILTVATDLILDANGYALIGEEGLVVRHASY